MTTQPDGIERTHDEQQEFNDSQHHQSEERKASDLARELAIIDANKDVELERIKGRNTIELAKVEFENEQERWWQRGRLGLIYLLLIVFGWRL